MSLLLEIVTPEKKAYSGTVEALTLPTTKGEVGILSGHIPMIVTLIPGEIDIESQGRADILAVDKGFAQIWGDKVSVLTEGAIDVEDIDLDAVEQAQARAEKALAKAQKERKDSSNIEHLEQVIRFSLTQKLIKKRR